MNTLMILNDPPYGTERTFNGLRLALNLLAKVEGAEPSRSYSDCPGNGVLASIA